MLPQYAIETTSFLLCASLTRVTKASRSSINSSTQPCSCLFLAALTFTSAQTVIQPAMFPAFGCAPLIPPRPAVKNILPAGLSPFSSFIRKAFITVIVVPCTMPCGPMYMYEPAVICPYCVTPRALYFSQSSGLE